MVTLNHLKIKKFIGFVFSSSLLSFSPRSMYAAGKLTGFLKSKFLEKGVEFDLFLHAKYVYYIN